MTGRPPWAPDLVDLEVPSAARVYDYCLGGSFNFESDRAFAAEFAKAVPDMKEIARANRNFLGRVVDYLLDAGIDQFLDLGSGIPATGNVHEVAAAVNPEARVVYVDSDPVTVATGRRLLDIQNAGNAVYIDADLRDHRKVLSDPEVRELLDLSRPIGVLMVAILHYVPDDDDPKALVQAYVDAVADGSYVALSHTTDVYREDEMRQAANVYAKGARSSMTHRSPQQIRALLGDLQLVEPGLVDIIRWRPEEGYIDPLGGDVTRYGLLAAVGRKEAR